jgi:cysteinyl-tRNA synthetase
MSIRVYNTLTKQKEPFETVVPGKVGMYVCGPTVYKESHIGHMVGPVIFDTIKRYLVYCGYDVTWVVNITDVDDKLIAQQNERGVPMSQIAEEMTIDYLNNLRALGVDQIDHMPKATEHMAGIIEFTQSLIDKGFAYASGGDVLFDVMRDANYGKLSNRRPEEQQGEGGGAASKKRSPGDFALWKSAKPGEPSWDSPWGPGRPGWHIECSAMSKAILGETFDIHGGGLDLVFPHHENELAQSECCHGRPMVKYWLHNGLLKASAGAGKVGGRGEREEQPAEAAKKVSRSEGAGGLADIIAAQGGERIRFCLLRTHYRSTVIYGEEALEEAATNLESFYRYFERFHKITRQRYFNLPAPTSRIAGEFDPAGQTLLVEMHRLRQSFLEKMDDDFNTGGALADLFDMVRELNKFANEKNLDRFAQLSPLDADYAARLKALYADPDVQLLVRATTVLRELANLLGLFRQTPAKRGGAGEGIVPKVMELLIELRAEARGRKDFATGDKIRNRLAEIGVTLEDRKGGATEWRMGAGS